MLCKDLKDLVNEIGDNKRKCAVTRELYEDLKKVIRTIDYGDNKIAMYSAIEIEPYDSEDEYYYSCLENGCLDRHELQDIIYDELPHGYEYVSREEDEDVNEWQRSCRIIFRDIKRNEYWALNYYKGLGEYQPDEIDEQPYRVKPVEKTIVVYEEI